MKISKNIDFDFFIRFAEGIQKFMGEKCEIIIHDFREGFDHSIVHIINGSVSGRSVGGSPRGGMIAHCGDDIEKYHDSRIYFFNGTGNRSGHIFKSCTTLINDEKNQIIGSVCVNLDVTDLILSQNMLRGFVPNGNDSGSIPEEEIGFENVDDVLHYYISHCEQQIGKPMSMMDRNEKIRALSYLNKKGVFKISKANVELCQAFQISKFTLYNYLEEAKQKDQQNLPKE